MDASAYTGFHEKLAKKIIPHLHADDTVCDIGCGLGLLDFQLAPHVSEISAVDVSESAIEALLYGAKSAGLTNIHAHCGVAEDLEGAYDIILMSLFGHIDMQELLKHCRRKIIRIAGSGRKSGLYPERHRRETKDAVPLYRDELAGLGVRYSVELCSFEFGQPLRTWHDAEQFVLINAPYADSGEVNEFLNENIERTGRDDFPFYLPYQKELGIFVIDKN